MLTKLHKFLTWHASCIAPLRYAVPNESRQQEYIVKHLRTAWLTTACAAALMGLGGTAHASWIQPSYSIDPNNPSAAAKNDNVAAITAYLQGINPDIVYLGSYLGPGKNPGPTPAGETITGSSLRGGLAGDWSSSSFLVSHFVVKAGPTNNLYNVLSPSLSGTWSTADISVGRHKRPRLSHMDFWGIRVTNIPEPASLAILGTSLLGLGLIRRTRRRV